MTDRTIDAQLAERLFECDVDARDSDWPYCECPPNEKGRAPHAQPGSVGRMLIHFTADWNGAGRVIEKMRERGWFPVVGQYMGPTYEYCVSFVYGGEGMSLKDSPEDDVEHESFPIAVALAALKALGEEVEA